MAVNEELQRLLDLQEVDESIADARVKQKKLPLAVEAERLAYVEAEETLKAAEVVLAGHEASRREHELALEEEEGHIDRLKVRLKEIGNTREYQAHIQEMDGVQRNIAKLEDDILQSLADIDTVNEELVAHRTLFDERAKAYKTERAGVDKELARIEKQVQKFLTAKKTRAGEVDELLLKRYDRITRTVRRAVVPVVGYNCAGCNMNVPPQLVAEVKRGNGIHQCPHCHRLLYMKPPVEVDAKS